MEMPHITALCPIITFDEEKKAGNAIPFQTASLIWQGQQLVQPCTILSAPVGRVEVLRCSQLGFHPATSFDFFRVLVAEITALCSTVDRTTPWLVCCALLAMKEECLALKTCGCFVWANLCASKWLGSGCRNGLGLGRDSAFFPPVFGTQNLFIYLFIFYQTSVGVNGKEIFLHTLNTVLSLGSGLIRFEVLVSIFILGKTVNLLSKSFNLTLRVSLTDTD